MKLASLPQPAYPLPDATRIAADGISEQLGRLDQNIASIAGSENGDLASADSQTEGLLEQLEIVQAVKANAKSLQSANEAVGTILDIKV